MWIRGNDYASMYSRYCGVNGFLFYGDVIQLLMKRRRELTYEQFHSLIDYAFRVPFRDDYGEFVNCIKHIRGETLFRLSPPKLHTPYVFDITHIRSELGLLPPKPLGELTSAIWAHPNYPFQSDVVPKLLQHYVFGKGSLERGRHVFYDF